MAEKSVAVVGLGYVGLPVALLASERGWRVVGVDINAEKVAAINKRRSPFEAPELEAKLKQFPIAASTDASVVAGVSIIVIAVPTPVNDNHQPDLEPLKLALQSIRDHLRDGQVIIVESTINPGVMDDVVLPLLRERGDLVLDADTPADPSAVHIAHCPERINPGDTRWTVRNIPRVIGGYSDRGVKLAHDFYASIIDAPIKIMASVTEAEAVKILENTFRDVNIAFINEMAKSFAKLNIDTAHVIAGAATKPFAFMPHYPGNGVGGHCISVDPYYMIERGRRAGFDHEFLKLARHINDSMPAYAVSVLDDARKQYGVSPDAPLALLGLAYKKNIDDLRESPAITMRDLLVDRGENVRVFDPHVPAQSTVVDLEAALEGDAIVVLATDHREFTDTLTAAYLKQHRTPLVVDGKNALNADAIAAAGIPYAGIGRARSPRA